MDDELLIDLVEGYPILYDKKHVSFKNHQKKLKVWQRIAEHMETDENTVKRRWINLRERYSKEMRQPPLPQWDSDNEVPAPSQWALFDRLKFLKFHIIPRPARQGPLSNKIIRPKIDQNSSTLDPLELMHTESKMEVPMLSERCSSSMNTQIVMNGDLTRSPSPTSSPSCSRLSPLLQSPSTAAVLVTPPPSQTTVPSSSTFNQSKRKALDLGELDSAMIQTAKMFQEICEQKARIPVIDPEISGFTTMIGAVIAKLKTKRRVAVIQRCTEIVMQAAVEEEDEQFYK